MAQFLVSRILHASVYAYVGTYIVGRAQMDLPQASLGRGDIGELQSRGGARDACLPILQRAVPQAG